MRITSECHEPGARCIMTCIVAHVHCADCACAHAHAFVTADVCLSVSTARVVCRSPRRGDASSPNTTADMRDTKTNEDDNKPRKKPRARQASDNNPTQPRGKTATGGARAAPKTAAAGGAAGATGAPDFSALYEGLSKLQVPRAMGAQGALGLRGSGGGGRADSDTHTLEALLNEDHDDMPNHAMLALRNQTVSQSRGVLPSILPLDTDGMLQPLSAPHRLTYGTGAHSPMFPHQRYFTGAWGGGREQPMTATHRIAPPGSVFDGRGGGEGFGGMGGGMMIDMRAVSAEPGQIPGPTAVEVAGRDRYIAATGGWSELGQQRRDAAVVRSASMPVQSNAVQQVRLCTTQHTAYAWRICMHEKVKHAERMGMHTHGHVCMVTPALLCCYAFNVSDAVRHECCLAPCVLHQVLCGVACCMQAIAALNRAPKPYETSSLLYNTASNAAANAQAYLLSENDPTATHDFLVVPVARAQQGSLMADYLRAGAAAAAGDHRAPVDAAAALAAEAQRRAQATMQQHELARAQEAARQRREPVYAAYAQASARQNNTGAAQQVATVDVPPACALIQSRMRASNEGSAQGGHPGQAPSPAPRASGAVAPAHARAPPSPAQRVLTRAPPPGEDGGPAPLFWSPADDVVPLVSAAVLQEALGAAALYRDHGLMQWEASHDDAHHRALM